MTTETTAPATSAASATATAPATAAPAASAAPSSDWTSGLNDDSRGFVQTKGWRSPDDVLTSYRGLEKLVGYPQDKLLQLPKDAADEAAWGSVYSKLGRPETADGYKLPVPEGDDGSFAKAAAPVLHKLGLSTKQAEGLAQWWNEAQGAMTKAHTDSITAKHKAEVEGLKSEWGAAYDKHATVVDRAAQAFGMDVATLDALKQTMGPAKAMKFLHAIGSKMGEAEYVDGKGQGMGVMTPEQAKSEIAALKQDKAWTAKYLGGDREALAQMERLHRWAYPE
jgi:hypothetical protein